MRTYIKVFQKNPEKLVEMLKLFKNGKTSYFLAEKYKVDHSTIFYHVRKYGIKRPFKLKYRYQEDVVCLTCKLIFQALVAKHRKYCSHLCARVLRKPKVIKIKTLYKTKFSRITERPVNAGKNYKEYLSIIKKQKETELDRIVGLA